MSSTRNSRNLLVNVFRPSYNYGSLTGFTPALSLSNIDTITATSVVTSNLSLGDASQNLFLGSNSGNLNGNNAGNTAAGYNAAGGISNVQNSVAVGKNAMAGVTDSSGVISIGADTVGAGNQSIYIGAGTRASGTKNIILGTDISIGTVSNRVILGNLLQGDQSNRSLDVCANQTVVWGKMGIQRVPQRSFEVLGDTYSTDGFVTGAGTVARPAFRFELDNSTGIYWPGSNKLAFAVGGVQRMVADTSTTIVGDLRVTGNFSAASGGGGGGVVGGVIDISSMTFSQYIRDNSTNPVLYDISRGNIQYSGALINTNGSSSNSIGGVTLSNSNVVVASGSGANPAYTFLGDAGAGMSYAGMGAIAFSTGGSARLVIDGTGNVGVGKFFIGYPLDVNGTARASNVLVGGYLRDAITPSQFDISDGNISNSGTTTTTNVIASGYLRNALTPTQFDISSGNIATSGTIYVSNAVISGSGTESAPAYSFKDDQLTGMYKPSSSGRLGFTVLGSHRFTLSALTAQLGYHSAYATQYGLDISFADSRPGMNMSRTLGSGLNKYIDFSSKNLSVPFFSFGVSNAPTGSGNGGADLVLIPRGDDGVSTNDTAFVMKRSNGYIGIGTLTPANTLDVNGTTKTTNALISGYIRDALTPTQFDISGGNISNSKTTTSSNFITSSVSTLNRIGGVRLNDSTIQVGNPNTDFIYTNVHIGGGYSFNGGTETYSLPAMAFSYGSTTGGYRHFIRTRHAAATYQCNAIDFFINYGTNSTDSIGPGVSNVNSMSIEGNRVAVFGGTSSGYSGSYLDVSGNIYTNATTVTSNILIGDGTSSAPSLAFNSAQTLGMYFVSPNRIAFGSNGTTRVTIGASNLFLGYPPNLSSMFALDVSGVNRGMRITKPLNDTANYYLVFSSRTTDNAYYAFTLSNSDVGGNVGGDFAIDCYGDNGFTIKTAAIGIKRSTGNVGIGTIDPQYTFDVVGTARASNILVGGYMRDAITPSQFDISSGNISNSGTTRSTNSIVSGYIRNATTPTQFDISGGNMRVEGILTAGVKIAASTITGNQTLARSDLNTFFLYTTSTGYDINLPAPGTASNGWNVMIRNMPASSANLTVKKSDATTLTAIAPGVSITVVCDGTNMYNI